MRNRRGALRWLLCVYLGALALGPSTAAAKAAEPVEVIARLVQGPREFILCGVFAFIGAYVYDVEQVVKGTLSQQRIVVDVLCPEMHAATFKPGQRHRLKLGPARRSYAGTSAPRSPLPEAPRYEGQTIQSAPR